MKLPLVFTDLKDLSMLATKWKSLLDPFLSSPSNQASILSGVVLAAGTNAINHKLGKPLTGWRVIGINAAAQIYDLQAMNQMPDKTLLLVSDAVATANIEVF